MITRSAAILGALVLMTIAFAISIGWLLAHPVQTRIGIPQPTYAKSASVWRER